MYLAEALIQSDNFMQGTHLDFISPCLPGNQTYSADLLYCLSYKKKLTKVQSTKLHMYNMLTINTNFSLSIPILSRKNKTKQNKKTQQKSF